MCVNVNVRSKRSRKDIPRIKERTGVLSAAGLCTSKWIVNVDESKGFIVTESLYDCRLTEYTVGYVRSNG